MGPGSIPRPTGGPIPRPDVREDEKILGNMVNDFDFNQTPRAPVLLPTNPPTDSPSIPAYFNGLGPVRRMHGDATEHVEGLRRPI